MGRAPCCDKANVKKGPWSPEEDAKLKAYIEEHGTGGNWIALPHKIGLKRCGKSCRLRWLNYLRPNIKHGGFTEEEDQIICSLYISIGSRWSIIAAQLPGRTDNDIKNYWNTRLKKKLLGKRRDQSPSLHLNQAPSEEANGMINHEAPSQTLSASALERMQLHMQLQGLYNINPLISFYNNPALWPKHHLLGDSRVLQSHPTDATATTIEQQANCDVSPVKPDAIPKMMMISANMQEAVDQSSALGFHLPTSGEAISMETSSSNFDYSAAAGLQADLQELVYGSKDSCFGGHEEHQLPDHLDCTCRELICGEKESTNWWPVPNGFEDKSSMDYSCNWDSASPLHSDSMIREFAVPYDL